MAVQNADVKEINLKTNKLVLSDGRQYELTPEMRATYENPEFQKVTQRVRESEKKFLEVSEKAPFGGELYAVSKGLAESNFGMLKNLFNKYAVQPGAAALSDTPMGMVDTIKAQRMGQQQAAEETEQKYPISTKIGQGLAVASDFLTLLPNALRGAATQGGLFGFSSAPPLYDDPVETAKGTATGALIGAGLGRVQQGLSNVASQRGAQRAFRQAESEFPQAQQQARDTFRQMQRQKLDAAAQDLRRGVSKTSLRTQNFINSSIRVSESAGSKEAKSVQDFIETVEKGLPDRLGANDVTRLFDAIEGRIARAAPQEIPLLQSYKTHLVEMIPQGAADQAVKQQIGDRLLTISRFDSTVQNIGKNQAKFNKNVSERMTKLVDEMSPEQFSASLQNGEMNSLIRNEIKEAYKDVFNKSNVSKASRKDFLRKIETDADRIANDSTKWLEKDLEVLASEARDLSMAVKKKVSSRIRNATGSPNPVMPEIPPTNRLNLPQQPIQPEVGRLAQRFEQPFQPWQQMQDSFAGSAGLGMIGKVAGIPYSMAKAGLGALGGAARIATEGVGRFLTAPTPVSALTRQAITTGGIPLLVQSISSTYPSYDKGILLDPLDRQDAVVELENNPYISLEDKALLQAKINRGKSLEELMETSSEVE